MGVEEQTLLRRKGFLGSKEGWGAKCSKEKNIPGGKVCRGVKFVKEQTVTSQFEANWSFEQDVTMQSVSFE